MFKPNASQRVVCSSTLLDERHPVPSVQLLDELERERSAGYLDGVAQGYNGPPGRSGLTAEQLERWRRFDALGIRESVKRERDYGECTSCGQWALTGSCEDEHRFGKRLVCGREWCQDCGGNWSDSHRRRFGRLLPELQQIDSLGYLVLTFPPSYRSQLQTKDELRAMGRYVVRLLKRLGVSKGIRRWHWFGDEVVGKPMVYHPHLNLLFPAGFVDWLDRFRELVGKKIGDQVVINYQYATEDAQKVHILKYVTRATFTRYQWDPAMAAELYRFRNTLTWGVWDGEPVWKFDEAAEEEQAEMGKVSRELVALESGKCPCCDKPIKWGPVVPTKSLEGHVVEDYGGGYLRLRAGSELELERIAATTRVVPADFFGDEVEAELERAEYWAAVRSAGAGSAVVRDTAGGRHRHPPAR